MDEQPHDLDVAAVIAQVCLGVMILLAVGAIRTEHLIYRQVRQVVADPGSYTWADVFAAQDQENGINLAWTIGFFVTAVAFIAWFYRARLNAELYHPTGLKWGHGWAVGGWFVPLLNLIRPYGVARDTLTAFSTPIGQPVRQRRTSALLTAWWLLFVVSVVGFEALRLWEPDTLDGIELLYQLEIAFVAASALAAAAGIAFIRQLTTLHHRRQDELFYASAGVPFPGTGR